MRGNGSPVVTETPAYNDPTKNGNYFPRQQQQWVAAYGNSQVSKWQGPKWKSVGSRNHEAETVSFDRQILPLKI